MWPCYEICCTWFIASIQTICRHVPNSQTRTSMRGPTFLIMEHIELSSFAGKIYNILAQESLRNLASVSEVCPKQCQKIPGSKPYFGPTLLLATADTSLPSKLSPNFFSRIRRQLHQNSISRKRHLP